MTKKWEASPKRDATGMSKRMKQNSEKRVAEQGAVCQAGVCASGHCAEGNCVRNAIIRLVVVAAALAVFAFASGQMAWLALSGLLLFSAAGLWALDKWSLARARASGRM